MLFRAGFIFGEKKEEKFIRTNYLFSLYFSYPPRSPVLK